MKVKSESEVAQSCPTLSDPMDCSLPGSSVHGIFQARVLEWGAIGDTYNIPFSNQIKPGISQIGPGRRPICLSSTHHLCVYVSLSIIYLPVFCSPPLYHLFPHCPSVYRLLVCYLCIYLTITPPASLTASFLASLFYLLLRLWVSHWALSLTMRPRQQPPDPPSPGKAARTTVLGQGPVRTSPCTRLIAVGLAGPEASESCWPPPAWPGAWALGQVGPLLSGASGRHWGHPWSAESGVESGERDVYSGTGLGSRLRRGGQ